jgi:ComF family protein
MLDKVLSIVAPHYCSECGEIGSNLCLYCKYNIADDKSFQLGKQTRVVGLYKDVLGRLIKDLKFERNKSSANILGELLHECLPDYGANVVVVPIPTIDKHIRQRGYDHMSLIARRFAKLRGYNLSHALSRASPSVQMGASAKKRLEQAKEAFKVQGVVGSDTTFLVLDDVTTTGATLRYAAKSLRLAGAKRVYAAAIAHQTLD